MVGKLKEGLFENEKCTKKPMARVCLGLGPSTETRVPKINFYLSAKFIQPPPPNRPDRVCPLQSWGTRPGIRPHPISVQLPNQAPPFNFGTLVKVNFGAPVSALGPSSICTSFSSSQFITV